MLGINRNLLWPLDLDVKPAQFLEQGIIHVRLFT